MDKRGRAALAGDARRRVVEAGVQERAGRRRDQPERPLRIAVVENREMVREGRHPRVLGTEGGPFGAEMEFLVAMAEAVEEMPGLEPGPTIEPDPFLEFAGRR